MITILTQNKALVNFNNCRTICIGVEDNKPMIVADEIILGYYNTIEYAYQILAWIANEISKCKDPNATIVMPPNNEDDKDAENN